MPKYFVDAENIIDNEICITDDTVGHIIKVLRKKIGDEIILCDGLSNDYFCTITDISKTKVTAKINETKIVSEPKIKITLFQGLPKSDKIEYIIQKTVELGVYSIVPVLTQNIAVKIDKSDNKAEKKILRYQKQSLSAAEQSGRGIIPLIGNYTSFSQAINIMKDFDFSMVLYESELDNSIRNVISNMKNKFEITKTSLKELHIGVLIGPEGGFSKEEINICKENNISSVSLGKRILRTETAGIVAISILMYELFELEDL